MSDMESDLDGEFRQHDFKEQKTRSSIKKDNKAMLKAKEKRESLAA